MPPAAEEQATAVESAPPTVERAHTRKPANQPRPKVQPPYAVVLHNDPVNNFDYVVRVLNKVLKYGWGKCFWLTLKVHVTGRSIIWSGLLEVAELKAEQIRDCGPDPTKALAKPLKTTTEPLPG